MKTQVLMFAALLVVLGAVGQSSSTHSSSALDVKTLFQAGGSSRTEIQCCPSGYNCVDCGHGRSVCVISQSNNYVGACHEFWDVNNYCWFLQSKSTNASVQSIKGRSDNHDAITIKSNKKKDHPVIPAGGSSRSDSEVKCCPSGYNCVDCGWGRSICCSTNGSPGSYDMCCRYYPDPNHNCWYKWPTKSTNITSSDASLLVSKAAGGNGKEHVAARLQVLAPTPAPRHHHVVSLDIWQEDPDSRTAILRLSGVKDVQQKFHVLLGETFACGNIPQGTIPQAPLLLAPDVRDSRRGQQVQLSVFPVSKLRGKPVMLSAINQDGTTSPYACGDFQLA